jgi:ABC-type uncharacterized transport system auxiliary subunit
VRKAITLAMLLVLPSCLGQRTTVRTYYVLNEEPLEPLPEPLFHGLLRVRNLNADEIYEKFQIIVRRSPYELRYTDTSVWAVKPYQMVSDIIASALEDTGAFEEVTRELGDSRPDYTLGGDLHAIEIYDSDDIWYAHLSLSLVLNKYSSGERLWSYAYDERKLLSSPSFSHAVRAISELLQMAIKESIGELRKVAGGQKAEPPRETPKPRKEKRTPTEPIYVPDHDRTGTPPQPVPDASESDPH